MGLFTPPEEVLADAMLARQPRVQLEHCTGSIDGIIKKALKKDRRLLAWLAGYSVSYTKKGMVQLIYDYNVEIQYREEAPARIEDVIVDNGDWDPKTLLKKGMPAEAVLVTADPQSVRDRLSEVLELIAGGYEGVHGAQTGTSSFEKLSEDSVCGITYNYLVPLQQLRQYQGKAAFAARNIWKGILGRAKVPQFVLPFLAFSYLTQECCYDQRAFNELAGSPGEQPSDPVPHLAYGPLVEKRGICGGFAWAFKTLMDEAHVECRCVVGYMSSDTEVRHQWNLVKIDGQFYHVDVTWGCQKSGVLIRALMQPDSVFAKSHIWNTEKYPVASGRRYGYDFVEDYLADNGNTYLDDGANENIFFPEDIME